MINIKLRNCPSFSKTLASGLSVSFNDFLGVLSVQGTATAVADGIAVKTAKFVTGNFIPVVGRMFTEAADTVISASGLLKTQSELSGSSFYA